MEGNKGGESALNQLVRVLVIHANNLDFVMQASTSQLGVIFTLLSARRYLAMSRHILNCCKGGGTTGI